MSGPQQRRTVPQIALHLQQLRQHGPTQFIHRHRQKAESGRLLCHFRRQHTARYARLTQHMQDAAASIPRQKSFFRHHRHRKPHTRYLLPHQGRAVTPYHIAIHKKTPPLHQCMVQRRHLSNLIQYARLTVILPTGQIVQRIHPSVVLHDAEVQMRAGGVTGVTGIGNHLSLRHGVTHLDVISAQMAI